MNLLAFALVGALTSLQTGSLEQAAKAFDDAQLHHDRAVIDAFLAADFQYVTRDGILLGRREFITATTSPGEVLRPFEVVDHRIKRLGPDGGIASGLATIHGAKDGKEFVDKFRYADVFERRDGRWFVVYTEVTVPK